MNRLKAYTAVILALSAAFSFTACKKDASDTLTTTATAEQVSTTQSNGYTYNDAVFTIEPVTEYVHVVPPVPTRHKIEKTEKAETAEAVTSAAETTSPKIQSDKIEEIASGINVLSKTSPVLKGNNASIVIIGTPDASYTIDFYETETKKAAYSGLEAVKADHSGIASWNFTIEEGCETGERKVIIREKNSDKFIQTSITVY